MSETIKLRGVTHAVEDCITCGVVYTIPFNMLENHRANGGFHSCPNGHSQGWTKERSESELIRRERDRLRQQIAQKDDEIARQRERREAAERSAAAYRGQTTRLRNRAKNGVCPCCNRSFANLRRHMESQHPTFQAEAAE